MIDIREKFEKCWYCENFYGSCFDEPVCSTCHYFIFPTFANELDFELEEEKGENSQRVNIWNQPACSSTEAAASAINEDSKLNTNTDPTLNNNRARPNYAHRNYDEKLESNDSGNEDSDNFEQIYNMHVFNNLDENDPSANLANRKLTIDRQQQKEFILANSDLSSNNNNPRNMNASNLILNERLIALSTKHEIDLKPVSSDLIESLPTEVLLGIFRNLDDLSLWSVSLTCKRWYELIRREINQSKWKSFISSRWILFKPSVEIKCYQTLYSQLVQSSNCFHCLQQIHKRTKTLNGVELKKSWRHRRLLLELKALQQDPPDGINAKPLDSSCFFWQASITGPLGSPYEGGIFYLYLRIPKSYPLKPPMVRFITKIYHPNVSKHGDIGLDSIHENWSLALTISKILISIQSLLTDPFVYVCMEQEIGRLYKSNRELYEKNARIYTWKYAMTDYMNFNETDSNLYQILSLEDNQ